MAPEHGRLRQENPSEIILNYIFVLVWVSFLWRDTMEHLTGPTVPELSDIITVGGAAVCGQMWGRRSPDSPS